MPQNAYIASHEAGAIPPRLANGRTAQMKTITTHYLRPAETAKLVRAALAKAFPGVKFSVRSKTYSGGASISVRWTDGPLVSEVERVAKKFEGRRFDGSIDLAWEAALWLLPDGDCVVASDPGSVGSGGAHRPVREWMPHPDAKLIRTGVFVSCQRDVSPELAARCAAYVARNGRCYIEHMPAHFTDREAAHYLARRARLEGGALYILRDRRL